MTAIDQHRELNSFRPAEIIQGIHRGANRPAAEEYIVHEHDRFAGDIERDDGRLDVRRGALVQIISMHGNIQVAGGNRMLPDLREQAGQFFRERHSAALYADQRHFRARFVALGDFVRDARERALDGLGV